MRITRTELTSKGVIDREYEIAGPKMIQLYRLYSMYSTAKTPADYNNFTKERASKGFIIVNKSGFYTTYYFSMAELKEAYMEVSKDEKYKLFWLCEQYLSSLDVKYKIDDPNTCLARDIISALNSDDELLKNEALFYLTYLTGYKTPLDFINAHKFSECLSFENSELGNKAGAEYVNVTVHFITWLIKRDSENNATEKNENITETEPKKVFTKEEIEGMDKLLKAIFEDNPTPNTKKTPIKIKVRIK